MNNGELLLQMVDEDFGARQSSQGRWAKGIEHDSLVVDVNKGIFFFNSRGVVGDPLVYLMEIRGMKFSDAKEYLHQYDYSGTHVYTVKSNKKDVVVYPKLVDVFFELGKNKRQYLYDRGITDHTIDRFQLGFYNEWTMIPFFVDGSFRNFQMRRDIPTKTFKKYYDGVGPLLFNSDILKFSDKVFITEGPIDALALSQEGFPAISTDMSGNMLPEWYSYFVNQKEIFILFDNDSAGTVEACRVAKVLGTERCKIYNFWDYEKEGYDPVDYFKEGRDRDDLLEMIYHNSKYCYQLDTKNDSKYKRTNRHLQK